MADRSDNAGQDAGWREVLLLFVRLGFTAFGGPAAHVALMEDQVVHRRRWVDRQHFLDLVAAINFIPGPNSTELAIHLGWLRAGWVGLVLAGVGFIVPAVLIILPLAWLYVSYGQLPQTKSLLVGINAAVVAIVAAALVRFARTAVKDGFTEALTVGAALAGFAFARMRVPQGELLLLAIAAALGAVWYARPALTSFAIPVWPWHLSATVQNAITIPDHAAFWRMGLIFLKVGATLFGSGYVLISYLQADLVDRTEWLTPRQLLDAIAVGQVTPGPLLTTATFVGYVLGHKFLGTTAGAVGGALLATACIFLPSFVFVAIGGRVLQRLRQNRLARGALDGMNAAVVALILVVGVQLAMQSLTDAATVLIACASAAALLVWNVNSTWLILGAALVGWAWYGHGAAV